jgi:hypothetical protein
LSRRCFVFAFVRRVSTVLGSQHEREHTDRRAVNAPTGG